MTECVLDTCMVITKDDGRPDRQYTVVSRIPVDFHSDGASVPRWAQWAIGRWGCHTWAALWHDWMYYLARRGMPICSRAEADRRLYVMARSDGMHLHTALLMWVAVRLGGRKAWRTS